VHSVVVAKYVPWPPNSGDKRRTLGVVRALLERGPVTICAFAGDDEDAGPLEAEGFHVVSTPPARSARSASVGVARTRSLTAARFWSPVLAGLVQRAAPGADVLVIEHVQLQAYARGLASGCRVLDMHNIESTLTARHAVSSSGLRGLAMRVETQALRGLERGARRFDVVAVASEVDRQGLRAVVDHPCVVVLPNAWDAQAPLPRAEGAIVSFVALMSWSPNVEAACWFVGEVWPRVSNAVPGARLQLVGRNPTSKVRALAGPSVVVTGTVDDLTPYYARTRVAVAPLLAGSGSRLKILEALSFGRPVVSTTIGVEGLEDLVGRGVVVADSPQDMARQIISMLIDPGAAMALGKIGAQTVEVDHSWAAATRPLLEAIDARLAR